jgi:hypothetical protein
MTGLGKDYRKGDPLRGAATLLLSLELLGRADATMRDLVHGAFIDLGVSETDARAYLKEHRAELLELFRKHKV